MQSLLFQTNMVQALMADRKTETRRMRGLKEINDSPNDWTLVTVGYVTDKISGKTKFGALLQNNENWKEVQFVKCPYKIGPAWVRETWSHTEQLNLNPEDENYGYVYKADGQPWEDYEGWQWKPSIHMPFSVARNFIHIDEIRLERLQSITEESAIAEGVYLEAEEVNGGIHYKETPRQAFEKLITSINGPECWEKNYWVWVVKFHRIGPENK